MRIKIITLFLLVLLGSLWATRYIHSTGTVSLRVDDVYPMGFVEFIYHPFDNNDMLWRAFFGIQFETYSPFYGRANDYGDLYEAEFDTFEYLDLVEDSLIDTSLIYDTTYIDTTDTISGDSVVVETTMVVDTLILQAVSKCAFTNNISNRKLKVEQEVTSYSNDEPYIEIKWILTNVTTTDLNGGKCVFHFDADIPDSDFDNDVPFSLSDYLGACQQASSSDSNCAGFIWQSGGFDHRLENTLDWYSVADCENALVELINGDFWLGTEYCEVDSSGDTICPVWVDTLTGECGIGILFSIPDLVPEETETLIFFFAGAPGPDSFSIIAETLGMAGIRELSDYNKMPEQISIQAYPNPFNSSCKIRVQGVDNSRIRGFEIFDLRGNLVAVSDTRLAADNNNRLPDTEYIWKPGESICSGIYLVRATTKNGTTETKRIVYLR